jgi:hypothetical protein
MFRKATIPQATKNMPSQVKRYYHHVMNAPNRIQEVLVPDCIINDGVMKKEVNGIAAARDYAQLLSVSFKDNFVNVLHQPNVSVPMYVVEWTRIKYNDNHLLFGWDKIKMDKHGYITEIHSELNTNLTTYYNECVANGDSEACSYNVNETPSFVLTKSKT